MSEWIPTHLCKPPESHSVLLYVVKFHSDGIHLWDDIILSGFYGDKDYDEVGFYIETYNDFYYLKETSTLRVLGWTLLPRKPSKEIFKEDGEWSC